jgi:ubiquinone/menaquinone biosynthesis C-methylase UbiE
MDKRTSGSIADVGKRVPAVSSTLRPDPLRELSEWGGARLVRRKRVLDLGCGDGRFALGVARLASSVDGLDPDDEAITAAKRSARKSGLGNVRFGVGAAQQLPFPDAAFDLVLLSWTL